MTPVEERPLNSGTLLKEMRRGEWPWPETAGKVRNLRRKLYPKAKLGSTRCIRDASIGLLDELNLLSCVCLGVNPVGKPDAVVPHVRFDERGWETELWHRLRHQQMVKAAGNGYSLSPNATAPIFDSAIRLIL